MNTQNEINEMYEDLDILNLNKFKITKNILNLLKDVDVTSTVNLQVRADNTIEWQHEEHSTYSTFPNLMSGGISGFNRETDFYELKNELTDEEKEKLEMLEEECWEEEEHEEYIQLLVAKYFGYSNLAELAADEDLIDMAFLYNYGWNKNGDISRKWVKEELKSDFNM